MFNSDPQAVKAFIGFCYLMISILIVFVITIIFIYKQKQNVYFKKLKEIKVLHENITLKSQIEIQEQTFQNISREIHDNIGQKLSLVKLHLNNYFIKNKNSENGQILDSINIVTETINDLSDLSRSLSSEQILNKGIIPALEYEVSQLKRSAGFDIALTVSGTVLHLEENTELVLFRIAQEALNNILKHAAASRVDLKFLYANDHVLLVIKDNGNGFSPDILKQPGIGLSNIKKRVSVIKGELNILSVNGTGTILTIKIPSI